MHSKIVSDVWKVGLFRVADVEKSSILCLSSDTREFVWKKYANFNAYYASITGELCNLWLVG